VQRAREHILPDACGYGGAWDNFCGDELMHIEAFRNQIWRSMRWIMEGEANEYIPTLPFEHSFKEVDPEEQRRRGAECHEKSQLWMANYPFGGDIHEHLGRYI